MSGIAVIFGSFRSWLPSPGKSGVRMCISAMMHPMDLSRETLGSVSIWELRPGPNVNGGRVVDPGTQNLRITQSLAARQLIIMLDSSVSAYATYPQMHMRGNYSAAFLRTVVQSPCHRLSRCQGLAQALLGLRCPIPTSADVPPKL